MPTSLAAILRKGLKLALPFAIAAACLTALSPHLDTLELHSTLSALAQISPVSWALALLATAASFWAVGRYDLVLHRHFATGVCPAQAARSGAAAIALGQALGFGLVTGALARWRLIPALGPAGAAAITALCAVSFLVALAAITVLASLLTMGLTSALWAVSVLAAGTLLATLALLHPALRLPTLPAMGAILGLSFLDTLFAAAGFWIFLPHDSAPQLAAFYPLFLLALGAGILSGAPAGLGAFELTLFALLPEIGMADLAVALVGFRLVYYALPALIGALVLLRPDAPRIRARTGPAQPCPTALASAPRAELGVVRQTEAEAIMACGTTLLCARTPQTLTALFDPAQGPIGAALDRFVSCARGENRVPFVYKCSARSAVRLRKHGFRLLHIADEALLDPARFDLSASRCRQLRRKLRKAEKADLRITAPSDLPQDALARIDADWTARSGPARGFSMGRFCPDYLAGQRVYVASARGRIIGFASFHESTHELCLDLMRTSGDAPDGTMHALIHRAITDAARRGVPQLSLAALPAAPSGATGWLLGRLAPSEGLAQFKLCFAPRLAPLYAAAPTPAGLALALADIGLAISKPQAQRTS